MHREQFSRGEFEITYSQFPGPIGEAKARMEVVEYFYGEYSNFFSPVNTSERNRPGSRLLLAQDLITESDQRYVAYLNSSKNYALPYNGLERAILERIQGDIDRSIPIVTDKRFAEIPNVPGNWSSHLSQLEGVELYLVRTTFPLISLPQDNGLNKAVEKVRIFIEKNGSELGIAWIGRKWNSIGSLTQNPTGDLVHA